MMSKVFVFLGVGDIKNDCEGRIRRSLSYRGDVPLAAECP